MCGILHARLDAPNSIYKQGCHIFRYARYAFSDMLDMQPRSLLLFTLVFWMQMQQEHGNKWAMIAKALSDRALELIQYYQLQGIYPTDMEYCYCR